MGIFFGSKISLPYLRGMENKNTMKEQEITGVKWNCLFYQPEGQMLVQIYNNKTEEIIIEEVVKNQEDYDFALEVFIKANQNLLASAVFETIVLDRDEIEVCEIDEDLPF